MIGAMAAVESTLPVVGKSSGGVFAYFFFFLRKTSTGTCGILINII